MKKLLIYGLLTVLLFLCGTAHTVIGNSAPEEEWIKTFAGSDHAYSVQQTSDGGFIVAGSCLPYAWLVKTDSNGDEQWSKTFAGQFSGLLSSLQSKAYSVQQTSDGGYILAGSFATDGWLFKTDFNGVRQWDKFFGVKGDDRAYSVQQTSDGGYILAGFSEYSTSYGSDNDAWLVKTDSNGDAQWYKTFERNRAYSVQQTSDGGYILAGTTGGYFIAGSTYGPEIDAWLVKTDSNGNKQWDKSFGGTGIDIANSVQQTSDGGYILAGYTTSFGAGSADVLLIKTDSNGNIQWDTAFGATDYDIANSVQQTSDGGYILAGGTTLYGAGSLDIWLVKTDSNGNIQWDTAFGTTGYDIANSVQQTSDGGYILTGDYVSYTSSSELPNTEYSEEDAWLIKVKCTENVTNTHAPDIGISEKNLPQEEGGMYPPSPVEDVPAFEAIFAIAGLFAVAYFWRRKG